MDFAPIIIFAFNRIDHLRACVASLLNNSEACESNLIIYVDGPRSYIEGEREKFFFVRDYIKTITGFKSLNSLFSEINVGLGPSIIRGVSDVMKKYGKAIVIEDDLIVGRNFLSFMNQGLNIYEHNKEVFSVCGYTNKIKKPSDYIYDAYFCPRSSSWGWATWADRWSSCDWELNDWDFVKRNAKAFNKWGGSDCYSMIKAWHEGKNQSWAIRFCYNQFIQDKQSLFPIVSHVVNNGFDGNGTNCPKWNRFKYVFDESDNKDFIFSSDILINKKIQRSALSYNSLSIRMYSKLRNMLFL